MKLNKYQELICCYVLVVLRTPKKVFSRSNFSYNVTHYTGRCSAQCIPTCSYCIYYCSLSSLLASPSSLLKVPNISINVTVDIQDCKILVLTCLYLQLIDPTCYCSCFFFLPLEQILEFIFCSFFSMKLCLLKNTIWINPGSINWINQLDQSRFNQLDQSIESIGSINWINPGSW